MTPTLPRTPTPTTLATPAVEICDDCYDNDGNGLSDHDDPQCTEPADGGGAGVDDPVRGKALIGCAKAIRSASGKLTAIAIAKLQRCLASVTTCVQAKPGDAACLTKARASCEKAFATIAVARAAFAPAVAKGCNVPALGATDLLDPSGLGYEAESAPCARYGVASLATVDDVSRCIADRHACATERLVGFQFPRAHELLGLVSLNATAFPCLEGTSDAGGAGVGAPTGATVGKCNKTLARTGAAFVRGRQKALHRCSSAVLTCIEQKRSDEACLLKAQAKCAASAAKLPALGKLNASLTKSCGPALVDPATLLAPEGLGFDANATICADRGVPVLASVDDVATCLMRQHQCEADQLLESELPRLRELLGLAGVPLP